MRNLLIITFVCCAFLTRASSLRETLRQSTALIADEEVGHSTLSLSMPEGELLEFELRPSEVMSPGLATNFPEIRTWTGHSVEYPEWVVRCDQSPFGLYVQIYTPDGTVYLDQPTGSSPQGRQTAAHQLNIPDGFHCLTESSPQELGRSNPVDEHPGEPSPFQQLHTFRLAVTTSGEYTQFHGGTVESALASVVTLFNRVSGLYERELGVRLVLVPGIDQLIFTNKNTDPFTNNSPSLATVAQAQATFDQIIGTSNYDVGMLLNTGTYGLAFLATVCDPQRKGSACMGLPQPVGEAFITYVAHEMAHQFGANHSFNTAAGFCGANRNASSAVEPGTGSTLLSYAGLPCANDSLQPLMNDYFHAESIREIRNFLLNSACGQVATTTNQLPTIEVASEFFIPKETPFTLSATGTDPDGDNLFYCWEQMDIGPAKSLFDPDNGLSPLFRSFPPNTNAWRTFPKWESLLHNVPSPGEQLPQTNRLLHFRVTARDSQQMGATAFADTHVEVIAAAGPFKMTSHNTSGHFRGAQVITWDVAGTTNTPIEAAFVNILLSTNGGETFNITLATDTPNDGTATVTFPAISCHNARLKIEPVSHVFFDINNADISICTEPCFTKAETSGTNLVLRWFTHAGKQYRLEHMDALSATNWTELNVSTTTHAGEMEAVVPMQNISKGFFRVREF